MYLPHTFCRACYYARPMASGIKNELHESLVEAFDLASQFHAAHQVYRHVDAVAAQSVQKTIMDVL